MNIDELDALMAEVDSKFNPLKIEEGAIRDRLSKVDTELKRLQGEYAAYDKLKQSLLEKITQEAINPPSADPASLTPDPFKKKSKTEATNAS